MRDARRLVTLLLATVIVWLALAPTTARAATALQGNAVTVAANQTINDDLYAVGGAIVIDGRVNGDIVTVGGTVTLNGIVTGNVIAAGGDTRITGKVNGTVRAAGGTITIDGVVGKDVVVAGGMVTLGSSARVGRDLWTGAGTTSLNGQITRNVQVSAGVVRINSGAVVGGNVSYTGNTAPVMASGAMVQGTVTQMAGASGSRWMGWSAPWSAATPGGAIAAWLRMLTGLVIFGLAIVLLGPGVSRTVMGCLERTPWQSAGLGLALVIAVPIAALIVFVVGLFVGAWWLALIVMALYLVALPVSMVIAALGLGHWIATRVGRADLALSWELLVGLVLLGVVSVVPWIGGLAIFVASLLGFGALGLSLTSGSRRVGRRATAPVGQRVKAGALI